MNQSLFSHSVQGLRSTNEDSHIILQHKDFLLLGVCDGHGGSHVSKIISRKIPLIFSAIDFEHPINSYKFKNICFEIQKKLKKDPEAKECGSTCTLFLNYKNNNEFYTINIGDSRIIACYKTYNRSKDKYGYKTFQLTKDHKPYDRYEKKLIASKGGRVQIVEGVYRIDGLALSRCFGDCDSTHITCEPDINSYNLRFEENGIIYSLMFVIVACDGLYDMLENEIIVEYVINKFYDNYLKRKITNDKEYNPASDLCQLALTNDSADNVTVVIKFFD